MTDPGGRETAHLVVLRDITQLKRTERRMRELRRNRRTSSQTLTASLRPASMPQVRPAAGRAVDPGRARPSAG